MNRIQITVLSVLFLILSFRIYQAYPLYSPDTSAEYNPTIEKLKQPFIKNAEILFPDPESSLLLGMVIGEKSSLPKSFNDALKNTATIHMIVVSGQNLTLLSGFILGLAPFWGRKKALIASILICAFYSVLTGFQIPVLRAFVMVLFVYGAQLFNRESDSRYILFLTAILMLIFEPNWLYSISFQLSFLATYGVVILSPKLETIFSKLPDIIRTDLCVSVCAQLMTWPIIAANFNTVSVVGLISNLLVLWTVPFIMISGVIVLFISLVSLSIASILSIFPEILLTYFVDIVEIFNKNWSSIDIPRLSFIFWLGYYFFILGVFTRIKNSKEHDSLRI